MNDDEYIVHAVTAFAASSAEEDLPTSEHPAYRVKVGKGGSHQGAIKAVGSLLIMSRWAAPAGGARTPVHIACTTGASTPPPQTGVPAARSGVRLPTPTRCRHDSPARSSPVAGPLASH